MFLVAACYMIVKLGNLQVFTKYLHVQSYSALETYAKDQIKEYMELSRQVERPAHIVDKRVDLALFFVNGLTSRQYTSHV